MSEGIRCSVSSIRITSSPSSSLPSVLLSLPSGLLLLVMVVVPAVGPALPTATVPSIGRAPVLAIASTNPGGGAIVCRVSSGTVVPWSSAEQARGGEGVAASGPSGGSSRCARVVGVVVAVA